MGSKLWVGLDGAGVGHSHLRGSSPSAIRPCALLLGVPMLFRDVFPPVEGRPAFF
jgi:hypothetical protein